MLELDTFYLVIICYFVIWQKVQHVKLARERALSADDSDDEQQEDVVNGNAQVQF